MHEPRPRVRRSRDQTSADEPKRLAGKLSFDDTASLGPKVDVESDAALVKEFKGAR